MTNKSIIAVLLAVIVVGSGAYVVSKLQQKQNSGTALENQKMVSDDLSDSQSVSDAESENESAPSVSEITLTISSPQSGGSVSAPKVAVKGKTSPKAEVFANEAEGLADASGNFSLTVALDEGENSIIVTAVDANGKVAEKEVLVTYEVNE